MNVEIGTETTQFPEKEYINGIFVEVYTIKSAKSKMFNYSLCTFHPYCLLAHEYISLILLYISSHLYSYLPPAIAVSPHCKNTITKISTQIFP
jgi:hypothetical protein